MFNFLMVYKELKSYIDENTNMHYFFSIQNQGINFLKY